MTKKQDVKDIVSQLQRLQIQQTSLISRLERLSKSENPEDTTEEFVNTGLGFSTGGV